MSNYTPSTDEMRAAWLTAEYEERGLDTSNDDLREEFNRWLKSVKADVWDEGFDEGHFVNESEDRNCECRKNPYRKSD